MKKELTSERLRELLSYDQETGVFTWKVKRRGYTEAGNVCGKSLITNGYQRIRIDGKRHHLGYFDTKEAAFAAYVSAKRQLHVANDL